DGRYVLRSLVGRGALGAVYEAADTERKRRVAVKVFDASLIRHPEAVARFRATTRAVSRLAHPHILATLDSGLTVDGRWYVVMEFESGRDLPTFLIREGRMGTVRAAGIARQICEALAAAHSAGIRHRCLRPEGVLLTERDGVSDFVKLMDF